MDVRAASDWRTCRRLGGPLVGDAEEGGDLGPLRRRAEAAVAQVREAHAR
jgi:hypothetical protein